MAKTMKFIALALTLTSTACSWVHPYGDIDPIELANRPLVTYDEAEIFGQVSDGEVTFEHPR